MYGRLTSEIGPTPSSGTVEEWTARYDIDPALILGWKVWYDDWTVFSSRDSRADDLPDSGVQAVKIYHRRNGAEETGRVYTLRLIGVDPYWIPGATRPKEGTWLSDEEHMKFCRDTGKIGFD